MTSEVRRIALALALITALSGASLAATQAPTRGAARTATVRPKPAGTRARKPVARTTLRTARVKPTRANRSATPPAVVSEPAASVAAMPEAMAAARIAPVRLTDATVAAELSVREEKAINAIKARGRDKGWKISKPFLQKIGDRSNPVTGLGPLTIYADKTRKPTSKIGRLLHALNPNSKRRMVVLVENGQVTFLKDQPDTLPYRLVRNVLEKLPIGEILHDATRSDHVRSGVARILLGLFAGGAFAGPVGGTAGVIAMLPSGIKLITEGFERRKVARKQALVETNAAIEVELKAGKAVTLSEAYQTYKAKLDAIKPGTKAATEEDFAQEIAAPPFNK